MRTKLVTCQQWWRTAASTERALEGGSEGSSNYGARSRGGGSGWGLPVSPSSIPLEFGVVAWAGGRRDNMRGGGKLQACLGGGATHLYSPRSDRRDCSCSKPKTTQRERSNDNQRQTNLFLPLCREMEDFQREMILFRTHPCSDQGRL